MIVKRNPALPLNKKNQKFVIEKTIFNLEWNEEVKRKTIDFWARRRFKFEQIMENNLSAKRGRWIGNLISNEPTHKIARLTITYSGKDLHCSMQVDTRSFLVSDWHLAWWNFDFLIFDTFLTHGDQKLEQWKEFKKRYESAYLSWSFNYSGGVFPMDDIDRQRYQELLKMQ